MQLPVHLSSVETAVWGGITFLAGIASKGLVDSYLRRRDDARKFLLDKRVSFLEQQLSKFFWPIYLHLEKDNLIWERMQERNQDEDSAASKLGKLIEAGVILPNHKDALAVIEANLHLAGDTALVNSALRYVRHVKVYAMLREAGIKDDPILHGEPYPKDFFPLIQKRVHELQTEYDALIARLRPRSPDASQ